MVVFDGLRDIDDPLLAFVVQDVVFAQVGMDEATCLVHYAHVGQHLEIETGPFRVFFLCCKTLEAYIL